MRTDYFAALRVPGVPGTSPATGDSANPHKYYVSPVSPVSPVKNTDAENCAPCTACGCGSYWQDADGWHCEGCTPAPDHVTRWRTVSGGKVAPTPKPAVAWPADMSADLRRVSEHFEWTDQDKRDFIAWARRSPQALADAAEFLRREAALIKTAPAGCRQLP